MNDLPDLFDVVPVSTTGTGTGRVTLVADGVETAAARTGLDAAAIWRVTWALVLARLAGVERIRIGCGAGGVAMIDVPRAGDVDAWLRAAAATPAHPAQADPPQTAWGGHAVLAWSADGNAATCHFEQSQIDRDTVERLGALLQVGIGGVVRPGARLEHVSPLSAAERTLVVETWNQTAVGYRPEATIHALFREQAATHPERVALAWDGGRLDYGELDRWSDALAERLIGAGVASDQPVALCMERGAEAIVAALAILKAGGAYLPLDPDHPAERLAFAIEDAGARVLVTSRGRREALAALASRTIFVEDAAADAGSALPRVERAAPGTRAYVMYTSGSTGTPKGVQIEHRSIVRLVGRPAYVALSPGDAIPARRPARVRRVDPRDLGPAAARRHLRRLSRSGTDRPRPGAGDCRPRRDLDVADLGAVQRRRRRRPAPAVGREAAVHGGRGAVARPRAARPGRAPGDRARQWLRSDRMHDLHHDLPHPARSPGRCAGPDRPADRRHAVLRAQSRRGAGAGRRSSASCTSAASGVARGYLARPELDAERFVADRFGDGRLYRTGDRVALALRRRARLLSAGRHPGQAARLPHRARRDRGATRRAPGRGVVRGGGAERRARSASGWSPMSWRADPERAAAPVLRAQLAALLPDFMVPSTFVALAALPVTANGKLDRAALPAPTSARPELAQPYRAPASEREATICAAFAERSRARSGRHARRVHRARRQFAAGGAPAGPAGRGRTTRGLTGGLLRGTDAGGAGQRPSTRPPPTLRRARAGRAGRADRHHRVRRTVPGRAPTSRRSGRTCATGRSRSASSRPDELDPSIPSRPAERSGLRRGRAACSTASSCSTRRFSASRRSMRR